MEDRAGVVALVHEFYELRDRERRALGVELDDEAAHGGFDLHVDRRDCFLGRRGRGFFGSAERGGEGDDQERETQYQLFHAEILLEWVQS